MPVTTNPSPLEQIHEVRHDCMRALDGMIGEDDTNEHTILATAIKFLVAQLPSRIALESHLRELGLLVIGKHPDQTTHIVEDIEPTEHDRRHYWTQQGVRLVPVSQAPPRLTPDHPHRVINVSPDAVAAMSAGEARMLAAALLSAAARADGDR